jgi:hypothetical protein
MTIQLTDEESRILRDLLHDYLPVLEREVARTEAKDFRHLLIQRQELVEHLLTELPLPAAS